MVPSAKYVFFSFSRLTQRYLYPTTDLYTALGTLFAVQGQELISKYVDCGAADSAVDTALDYLNKLGDVSPAVARCRKYFHSLRAWSDKRRSPLNTAILRDMQVPVSIRAAASTRESGRGVDSDIHLDPMSISSHDFGENAGEFLCDPTSGLFLEPLLPDLFFDI